MRVTRRTWLQAAAATGATMAGSRPLYAAPFNRARLGDAPVTLERGFTKVGYGQLHYRLARPVEPDKATARPVVCFHQTPNSSQVFIEFMAELARDRWVYAVDTPGLGESDLPMQAPELGDYAAAMAEFLAAMQLDKVDLVGYHTGASIAAELANREPARVRRLLLVGLALFDAEERAAFFDQPWPKPVAADGSHLLDEWERSHRWRGAGQSDVSVRRTFIEKLSAGDTAWWVARAVMRHDLAAALAALEQPLTVVNTRDDLFDVTPRVRGVRDGAALITLEDAGFGVFEARAADMAAIARETFDSI